MGWVETLTAALEHRARKASSRRDRVESAVLVPILLSGAEPELLFIRRPDDAPRHAGQVAFPGGRTEPADGGPVRTALREMEEELGLPGNAVRVLGLLDDVWTVTGPFVITPVVGTVEHAPDLVPHPVEVAGIFQVPVRALQEPARCRVDTLTWQGRSYQVPYYDWPPHTIWGATGRIVKNLLELWPKW